MKAIIISSRLEIESVVVVNDDGADQRAAVLKNTLPAGYVLTVKNVDTYDDAIQRFDEELKAEAEEVL